jgi:hypothetical protein
MSLWDGGAGGSIEIGAFWLDMSVPAVQRLALDQHWSRNKGDLGGEGAQELQHSNSTLLKLWWCIHLRELALALESGETGRIKMDVIEDFWPGTISFNLHRLSEKVVRHCGDPCCVNIHIYKTVWLSCSWQG